MTQRSLAPAAVHGPDSLVIAREHLHATGFAVIRDLYDEALIQQIVALVEAADSERPTFRRTAGLFAIRQFLKELPEAAALLCNERFRQLVADLAGPGYFIVKSIYFDKPEASNWFVAYHQDLSISVDRKGDFAGFSSWTVKQNQYSVQPPLAILEDNLTVRIHLDDTTAANGALRVVPGSHGKGVYRPEAIDWSNEYEVCCEVPRGGVMLMRPLLLHASDRTTNHQARRVVHIELSRRQLPQGLSWSEMLRIA